MAGLDGTRGIGGVKVPFARRRDGIALDRRLAEIRGPASCWFRVSRPATPGPDKHATDDLIPTRILTLDGLEDGVNRGPGRDSLERYIYSHGTNHERLLGRPVSHGCIRFSNEGVCELFVPPARRRFRIRRCARYAMPSLTRAAKAASTTRDSAAPA